MARKDYPFDKKIDKQMGNLVSGMLTRIILSPFLLFDNKTNDKGLFEGLDALSVFYIVLAYIALSLVTFGVVSLCNIQSFLVEILVYLLIFFLLFIISLFLYILILNRKHKK